MKRVSAQDNLVLLFIMLVWGFNFVSAKIALREFELMAYVTVRNLITLVVFGLIILCVDRRFAIARVHVPRMLLIGAIGIAANQLCFNIGIKYTTASNASLIMATSPIFGLLFGMLFDREKVKGRRWLGVVGALAGVGLVIGGQGSFHLGPNSLLGDLLMLGAASSWAFYAVLGRPILKFYSPVQISAYATLFGVPLILPVSVGPALAESWGNISALAWIMAVYVATFSAITAVLWYRTIGKVGASHALIFMYLVPVFGVFSGVLFFNEMLSLLQIAGAVVVLGGVYTAQRG